MVREPLAGSMAAGGYSTVAYAGANLMADANIHENLITVSADGALPVYADNAAALAAFLVPGQRYRTAAGIVMIVYTP